MELWNKIKESDHKEEAPTIRLYGRVLWVAAAVHLIYLGLFCFLHVTPLVLFNLGSVLFYSLLHLPALVRRQGLVLFLVHVEVCTYVCLSVLLLGWKYGFQYLLICAAALSYFCPYRIKYIPYCFSLFEMFLFLFLRLYSSRSLPLYGEAILDGASVGVSVLNACMTFLMIIAASLLSKLSAQLYQMQMTERNRALLTIAEQDELTGLLNRRCMMGRMKAAMDEYQACSRPFCVIIGDIDDFKKVNDTYGHDCGDYILRELALLMKTYSRQTDSICRWGGEEFLILLSGSTPEEASVLMERLRAAIEKAVFTYGGQTICVTMTLGVSSCTKSSDLHSLLVEADNRLYRGKRAGKNCVIQSSAPADR